MDSSESAYVFPILKYFKFSHLPEHVQRVSENFSATAKIIADRCIERGGDRAETTACLRKLLEAKDCAVRALL